MAYISKFKVKGAIMQIKAAVAGAFTENKAVTLTGDATGTDSSTGGWTIPVTLANSGVTAGSYGPSADASPAAGETFTVPEVTVDAKGRVTSASSKTITLPVSGQASPVTWITDSNSLAVASGSPIFNVELNMVDGDIWEGWLALGVGSEKETNFCAFMDEIYTVNSYHSHSIHNTSATNVYNAAKCYIGYTSSAGDGRRCLVHFTIAQFAGQMMMEGTSHRKGTMGMQKFIISRLTASTASLQITADTAIAAGHNSYLMMRKIT